jgi:hypothetical protein
MVDLSLDYFITNGLWFNETFIDVDHEALISFVKHVYGMINFLLTWLWFDYDWFTCVWPK